MKKNHFAAASLVVAAMLAGGLVAIAQQANTTNRSDQNRSTSSQSDASRTNTGDTSTQQNIGRLDDKTPRGTARVSQIIGANIKNSNGDSVGEIKDLVIDQSGKIRYAAVTYGGFLGVGTKMYAVPFEAFQVRQNPNDPDDRDDYVLTLNVTKDQLDGAEGFDSDSWPDFANTKFTQDLDRRYKVTRNPSQSGSRSTR